MALPIPPKESPSPKTNSLLGTYGPWLYGALALAAFSRCLFLGQAYFDNDLLAQFGPWRAFLRGQLLAGHLPLWNPYLLGGCPFIADPQNMVFYPLNWLTLLFPAAPGLSLFFCLHLFLAMWGMDHLLRSFGLPPPSRFAGALVYGFSNFFWLELIHPPVLAAFALLPWMFWALHRWAETHSSKWSFLSGLFFALLFLCGSPQMTIGAFYGGLVFFLYLVWKNRVEKTPFPYSRFLFSCLGVLWGALPLLAQLIPSLEFSKLTDRGAGTPWEQLKHSLSLDPAVLYQLFLPRLQLPDNVSLAEAVQYRNGPENLATNFLGLWAFVGIWTPPLALGALIGKRRNKTIYWFFLALAGLVLSLGQFTPLYHWIFLCLPGFSMIRVAYRYVFLFVLALSVLAAWGWEGFFQDKSPVPMRRIRRYLPWIYGLLLLLLALIRPDFNWREILGLGLGLLALGWMELKPSGAKLIKFLVLSALGIPLFLNAWGNYQPGPSTNFDFEKNSKGLAAWGQAQAPRRVFFDNTHMYYPIQVGGNKYILNYPQNAAAFLGIKDIGGYNPLALQTKTDLGTLPFPLVARLGAIGGLVTGMDQLSVLGIELKGKIPGFNWKIEPPYSFLTPNHMPPYVFAPQNVTAVTNSKDSLALLRAPGFDPDQTAVLLSPPPFSFTLGNNSPSLSYQMLQDEPDRQTYEVSVSQPCITVYCETAYPGWKAWVDGKSTPVLTADHLLRALALETGSHRVEFRFEPFWWPGVAAGLAVWVLLTSLMALLSRKHTARRAA
jgi:hypothetical protein